ncbi:MAG TPA: hypothetical protein VFE62_12365 [Gemmataceae bacterium]|nr:hypothetical protein [Gemmataceae bacterium]
MRRVLAFITALAIVAPAVGQDWQPVTEALIVAEKPGFGKLCGVVVDHATGDVTINLSDKGHYRSTDQGKSWQKLGMPFKGRTETPGCIMLDPAGGKRLVTALVYGAPILVSPDRGETWKALDKKSMHVDWCAVDWSDPDLKLIFTLKHESGGLLLISRDGGKSFEESGKGYGPAWIFDGKTAVVAQEKSKATPKPGLLRSTDGGKTFEPNAEYHARALPRWHKDTLYWLVEGALIKTSDQGKSWQKISDVKGGIFGPIFGKSADHLFLLTQAGILESTDGGKAWGKPIAIPKGMKSVANLSWMEFDPVHDTLYVMKMGSELYRWQRKQ